MQRLRLLREKHHLSQKEVAAKIHKTPQAYSLYEQGKRSPDVETLIQLADFFHVSVDYLLGHEVMQPADAPAAASKPEEPHAQLSQDVKTLDPDEAAQVQHFLQYLRFRKEAQMNPELAKRA